MAGKCQSGTPLILQNGGTQTIRGDGGTSPSLGSERNAEMVSPGFFSARECCQAVPVLLVSVFGYECWGYHLHLGENCVLCFSGILFRGTLVLSFNQENRLVVFLLLNF